MKHHREGGKFQHALAHNHTPPHHSVHPHNIPHNASHTFAPFIRALFWGLALILPLTAAFYGGTALYLAMRDPVLTGLLTRQAKMQEAYEDRLSAMREDIDRITSRQLLDQNSFDGKLHELISRQAQLEMRNAFIAALAERVNSTFEVAGAANAVPSAKAPDSTPEKMPDKMPEKIIGNGLTITDAGVANPAIAALAYLPSAGANTGVGAGVPPAPTAQNSPANTNQIGLRNSGAGASAQPPLPAAPTTASAKPKIEDDVTSALPSPSTSVAPPPPLSKPSLPTKERQSALSPSQAKGALTAKPTLMAKLSLQDDLPPAQRLQFVLRDLDQIEAAQMASLDRVGSMAQMATSRFASAFQTAGLGSLDIHAPNKTSPSVSGGVGGPFIPLPNEAGNGSFEHKITLLESQMKVLAGYQAALPFLPVRQPLANGVEFTSGFGVRIDPFIGRPAMHAGIDMRERAGSQVRATAAGKIESAGWAGGYGNMVEIDHGNGLATRFGHLSEILVHEGQTVKIGDVIGLVGSTGRSTAPHLHYETRIYDEPVDPLKFLRAGHNLGLIASQLAAKSAEEAKGDAALD